jgi:hypothetical protein
VKEVREFQADYGKLPDLAATSKDNDILFTWNGMTSGVMLSSPNFLNVRYKCTYFVRSSSFLQIGQHGPLHAGLSYANRVHAGPRAHGPHAAHGTQVKKIGAGSFGAAFLCSLKATGEKASMLRARDRRQTFGRSRPTGLRGDN